MMAVVLAVIAVLLALTPIGIAARNVKWGNSLVYGSCLGLSLVAVGAVAGMGVAAAQTMILPFGLPWLGMHLRIDALTACFLVIVNFGGASASLFALGYGRHEHEPGRVLPFFPAFLAGMNLVLIAADAFTFLFAWELMSLASWALVMAHHHEAGNARAGIVYLVMAVFSGLTLLLAFGVMAGPNGGYTFEAMRHGSHGPWLAALVLTLAILGAGSKAGLVPLHVWLPLAHPAAPSHVSALMSGVMTKVAVYGFLRIVFDLLGPPAWWWAVPPLVLGGLSAVVGVLNALMERDMKRLLAYSTIENVGIIFLGLGIALAFRANAMMEAAALVLTAALFHAFNHMLFKSALFFGAGTLLVATGTRDIERMGGLIHRMPYSSAAFLVACMAISALPPLNGFVSEWLTFQAILVSPQLPQWTLRLMVPAVGALLALAAALAAACFVRAFGIAYLGRPRSLQAEQAVEADGFSLAAMGLLAFLCLLVGVFPGLVMDALSPVVQSLVNGRIPTQVDHAWLTVVPITDSRSSYNGLIIFLFVTASASLAAVVIHRFASRAVRRVRLWDCGYPDLGPMTQYSAASLAQPIRRVFGPIMLRSREFVVMPPPGDPSPARIEKTMQDLPWDLFYAPIERGVGHAADLLNHLQFLTIRRYLGFVFFALISLLMALALWQ